MELVRSLFIVINMYVLYTKINNNLSIHYFNTVNQCLDFVSKNSVSAYKYKVISEQLPMDFYFAFFWNDQVKDADINIDVAKEIKRDQYRQLRDPLLQQLDLLFIKCLENDDVEKKSRVVFMKNKLRDITMHDLPNCWQELLHFYPNCLIEANSLINE